MRALVTGATGFLGERLTARLVEEGFDVTATGRDLARGALLAARGARFEACDLRDGATVRRVVEGNDVVFHCAALSSPWGRREDFVAANVDATRHVVTACERARVGRLVHVSTPSVYATTRDRLGIRESSELPAKPINVYAETKRLAEVEVERGRRRGLSTVIARPQGIFGPGDAAVFPRFIAANRAFGIPWLRGGGALVDITYVDNVVDLLLLCLAPAADGRVFNVSNGEPRPIGAILEKLFDLLGEPLRRRPVPRSMAYALAACAEQLAVRMPSAPEPKLTRYGVTVLGVSRTLCIDAARSVGYSPRVGIDEGLERFASWWRSNG